MLRSYNERVSSKGYHAIIRHKNGAFGKLSRFKLEEFDNAGFAVDCSKRIRRGQKKSRK